MGEFMQSGGHEHQEYEERLACLCLAAEFTITSMLMTGNDSDTRIGIEEILALLNEGEEEGEA